MTRAMIQVHWAHLGIQHLEVLGTLEALKALEAGHEGLVLENPGCEASDPSFLLAYVWWLDTGDALEILNLAVIPSHRRQGLGRALVERTGKVATERGRSAVFLEVRPSNESAVALYRYLGFERVGIRKAYYPGIPGISAIDGEKAQRHLPREDAWVMRQLVNPIGKTRS